MKTRVCIMFGALFLAFAGLLFGAAGALRWVEAWVFLSIFIGGEVVATAMLARHDRALFKERLKSFSQHGQPVSDRILMGTMLVLLASWLGLMGLDARISLSGVPTWLKWAGGIGVLVSKCVTYEEPFRENTFAVAVVRIQEERSQRVISTGPYSVVRHPLYAGFLVLFVSTPLLLGSWWGLMAAPLLAAWVAVRIALEERWLEERLSGYVEYAVRVPYRVIPNQCVLTPKVSTNHICSALGGTLTPICSL